MARSSSLRASDADRDAVAERLQQAAVEGRLEPHELEQRLHVALRARTWGELDRLLVDLPRRSVTREHRAAPLTGLLLTIAVRLIVVVLVAAALAAALAVTAAWWLIGLLVWLSLRSGRSWSAWHRPPRTRRVC